MNLFGLFRNPAKRYARELGPWLRKSYGSSAHYTEGQIRRGVGELRLKQRFIALGYAAFMDEADFEALHDKMPVRLSYQDARAQFERFRPPPSKSWPPGAGPFTVDPSDVAAGMDFHSN
jgi:hypothetical protein